MPRRKKKSIAREPKQRGGKRKGAGRPKAETTIERERDVRAIVLNQPHRRGNALGWLAEPVGRILESSGPLTHRTRRSVLYESANRFSEAYSRYQGVKSSARPFANSTAGSDGDIPEDLASHFERSWMRAWAVLRSCGEMREKAVMAAVIDPQAEDWRPPFWIVYGCIEGLKVLATHFGLDYHGDDIEGQRDAA